MDNLQALTWNMNSAPLPAMLDLFHEFHPSAHLHLILRNRKFKPLSRTLLSSPQLYTLDTEIYRTMPEDTSHSLSELSFIKNNLAPSLRVLRLSSRGVHAYPQRAQFEDWESVKYSMFNLDFQPGDRFPALLELGIGARRILLDRGKLQPMGARNILGTTTASGSPQGRATPSLRFPHKLRHQSQVPQTLYQLADPQSNMGPTPPGYWPSRSSKVHSLHHISPHSRLRCERPRRPGAYFTRHTAKSP